MTQNDHFFGCIFLEDVTQLTFQGPIWKTHSSKPDSDPLLFELVAWVDEAPKGWGVWKFGGP